MKNFLCACLFLILFFELKISLAQTYHPFADTLAQWSEAGAQGGDPDFPFHTAGFLFTLASDTQINGKEYTLVGFDSTFYVEYWAGQYPYLIVNYSFIPPGNLFAAIREDSDKKVWFRRLKFSLIPCPRISLYEFPIDSDILLYDFGLQVGDTAKWFLSYSNVVQKIDSVQLSNGEWHQRIAFDSTLDPLGGQFWIEGIGSSWGLLGPYYTDPFENGCGLNCFRVNNDLLYPGYGGLGDSCDHVFTGASEINDSKLVTLFPNPASDFVIFNLTNFTTSQSEISIYNSTGELLRHFSSFHSSNLKIPVDEIGSNGMYFYLMKVNNENLFTGKFLIQR